MTLREMAFPGWVNIPLYPVSKGDSFRAVFKVRCLRCKITRSERKRKEALHAVGRVCTDADSIEIIMGVFQKG